MIRLTTDKLTAAAAKLPTAPQTFCRLEATLRDPRKDLGDVTELLRTDAALAAAVLRLANSAVYALSAPADSLEVAINRVGFREVHRLVGMATVGQLFQRGLAYYALDGGVLWENSLACALASELLARQAGLDPQHAYTTGILRSLGKLMINTVCSLEAAPATIPPYKLALGPLARWEMVTVGRAGTEIGAAIMQLWRFPPATCTPVHHHAAPDRAAQFRREAALLHLGAAVAQALGKGVPGEESVFTVAPAVLALAKIHEKHVAEVIPEVRNELNRLRTAVPLL